MNHTCDRSVHFSCGHKTVTNTKQSSSSFFFSFCVKVCEREKNSLISPLSFFLCFFGHSFVCVVLCAFETQHHHHHHTRSARSSTTTFAFFRSRREKSNSIFGGRRRRGQAAASSSLCRSEQRRGCDLTAASFCPPLSRGIIVVIDSHHHHHQVRVSFVFYVFGVSPPKERKKERKRKSRQKRFWRVLERRLMSSVFRKVFSESVHQSKLVFERERDLRNVRNQSSSFVFFAWWCFYSLKSWSSSFFTSFFTSSKRRVGDAGSTGESRTQSRRSRRRQKR